MYVFTGNGCILGDPLGKHIVIDNVPQWKVKAKETASSKASSLALKLMDVFFTREELAKGNCTETDGRELLRPTVIEGIRCKFVFVCICVHVHLHVCSRECL